MNSSALSTAQPAGLTRRLASLCYEALLLVAVLFISTWIFLFFYQVLDPAIARPLLQIWVIATAAVYFIYCWTHNGQTLPMKTWRMRVVAQDGGRVTLRLGIYRYLFSLLSIASCGLGWLWALFDRDRQFLHDRLAGTRIIQY